MSTITAPSRIPYENLEMGMIHIETFLNGPGYIPVVSIITGLMRQVVGIAQLIISLAAGIFNLFRQLFAADRRENQEILKETVWLFEYAIHGLANIFRGQIEAIPLIQWSCFLYDQIAGWRWVYRIEQRVAFGPLRSPTNHI